MAKVNRDMQLINKVNTTWLEFKSKSLSENEEMHIQKKNHVYPLDDSIIKKLTELSGFLETPSENDQLIYSYTDKIKTIWKEVIERSIMCLRYYDSREPFIEFEEKIPGAYGIDDLMDYYDAFTDFETLLYGGSKYYRDHVIHAFRVWILGLKVMLEDEGAYLKHMSVGDKVLLSCFEKLSIWSMTALMHDLGYPLEKSQKIIDKTKGMMTHFVANPSVTADFAFSGVQNNINDFILRLMSSKMVERYSCKGDGNCEVVNKFGGNAEQIFVARLQPKYYFKLSKSLEKSNHGIISSIIVYKILQYFFESDYSIDEDYFFDQEGARQFYIRREILRAVASHTCHDIYHQQINSFAYLLIITDDSQDWGRRHFSNLYYGTDVIFEKTDIEIELTSKPNGKHHTLISEEVTVTKDIEQLEHILKNHYDLSQVYRLIFKDGLDTKNRDFELTKKRKVTYSNETDNIIFELEFNINKDTNAEFKVSFKLSKGDSKFTKEWFKKTLKINESKTTEVVETGTEQNKVWSIEPNVRFKR